MMNQQAALMQAAAATNPAGQLAAGLPILNPAGITNNQVEQNLLTNSTNLVHMHGRVRKDLKFQYLSSNWLTLKCNHRVFRKEVLLQSDLLDTTIY